MESLSLRFEIDRMKFLEKFINLKPPLFEGRSDPSVAENWLVTVTAMFNSILVPTQYRVGFATYLFEGPPEEWWDLRSDHGKSESDSWRKFKDVFWNTYVLGSPDEDMATQFRRLNQTDDTTVYEYFSRFSEMCRFDPLTEADPASKCSRFGQGLRPKIRDRVVPFVVADFKALVEVALRVEADLNESSGSDRPFRQFEGMNVLQYRGAFVKRYGPSDRATVADRVLMCIKFKDGLIPEIRSTLKGMKFHSFNALVEAARRAETAIARKIKGTKMMMKKKMNQKLKKKQEIQLQSCDRLKLSPAFKKPKLK